jgi:hypothetical protein
MTSSSSAWLFEDFSQPEKPVGAADAPPPEPTFDAAELAAARLESWNDGYLASAAASSHSLDRDGQTIFADLLARADDMDEKLGQMAEQNAIAIARWLAVTFATAFPNLSDGSMVGRTRAVVNLLQSTLRSQSKIEVRGERGPTVSFHSMHDVCREIETQQIEDPTGGSIFIAWQQGEAQINPSRTWDDIRSAIMPVAAGEAAENSFELRVTQGESIRHVG